MFAFRSARGRVEVGFTDRRGGVSAGPYESLNLGHGTGDDPSSVDRNFALLAEGLARGAAAPPGGRAGALPAPSPPLVTMRQVHGADVCVLADADLAVAATPAPVADALVTAATGVGLVVRVADCVPVILADPVREIVSAVHAGRTGLVAGVIPKAVAAMRDLGAGDLLGWIGPHICGACYQVPDRLRAQVAAVVPESYAVTRWHTPGVDLGAGVQAQLEAADARVVDVAGCTREDAELFSYRRQGAAGGRSAGVVWVRP